MDDDRSDLFHHLVGGAVRGVAVGRPLANRTQRGNGARHRSGRAGPAKPGAKIMWTTIVATVLFVSVAYVFTNRWITIDDMASWIGMPK